jgi:hypothetical protein
MGIWKRITGIEKIEKRRERAEQEREEAEQRLKDLEDEHIAFEKEAAAKRKAAAEKEATDAAEAKRLEEERKLAKLDPKERATKKGEAWVDVLQTHVDENNLRNGFFELDWNRQFVDDLIQAGYGTEADPEEEIVDRWFRDIVSQMLTDEGLDPTLRGGGFVNVEKLSSGRSEIS